MGISGLLPLLKDAQEEIHISKYKGKTLGVDAYVWLHRGAYGCAQQLALGQTTTSYVNFAMNKVNMLKYHGITPYIVFDGGPLPAKAKTETERAKRRNENLSQAKLHLSQGRSQQARDYFTKCVDVTPAMAYQFIKALRAAGVDYIVAPYEADAQLAYLERRGTIQGVITEDSDLLVFGCKTVLYKLNDEGRCIELLHQNRNRCKTLQLNLFTDAHFRQMAILSGCDYLDSIPGMGLKTAHRLLKQCGSVARALSAARMEGMRVPTSYQKDFEMAEKTFVYQRVFHRSSTTGQTRMVTLTPCNGQPEIEEEDCIGSILPEEMVNSIARGDVDPITKKAIVDLNPTSPSHRISRSKSMVTSSSSFYAAPKPKLLRETQSAGQKTLDTFFSRSQRGDLGSGTSSRKPLASVINTSSTIITQDQKLKTEAVLAIPDEKSKYFSSAIQASSPVLDQEQKADFDHLASFTPTQSKRTMNRCLSTDSGEISSPAASSAQNFSRERLRSSPLIDDGHASSPSTSPTLSRPRSKVKPESINSPTDAQEDELDIEEDNLMNAPGLGLNLQQFAFQQTPLSSRSTIPKGNTSHGGIGSTSSGKRRLTALLQFHNDEEEENIFGDTIQTPLVMRSHSESIRRSSSNAVSTINRPSSLKRIRTSNK